MTPEHRLRLNLWSPSSSLYTRSLSLLFQLTMIILWNVISIFDLTGSVENTKSSWQENLQTETQKFDWMRLEMRKLFRSVTKALFFNYFRFSFVNCIWLLKTIRVTKEIRWTEDIEKKIIKTRFYWLEI